MIYFLINRCATQIKIKMSISPYGSLDGLRLIDAKLLEYITCILCLANESALFGLFGLKFKKECDDFHHEHFKHIRHNLAKLFKKGFVSRTKDNIINIYLAYKQIFSHFSSEESGVGLTNPKTIFNKKITKTFISCS
jgi:hypothetical protein